MLEYYKLMIEPLNDKLGLDLGIRKINVKYVPQYIRYDFVNKKDLEALKANMQIHKENAGFHYHQYLLWSDLEQPLAMYERII